jgi:hypothetical protein
MAHPIRIKFHGVRAIHPAPGLENKISGGNTSCIELIDDETILYVNAGYGLATNGDELLRSARKQNNNLDINLLFSDYLWDSTLGLASFSPVHDKSTNLRIMTAGSTRDAQSGLDDVTSNLFSPFDGFHSLAARKKIIQVSSNFELGQWMISAKLIPNKLTTGGASVWRLKHKSGEDIGIILLCETIETTQAMAASFLEGCRTLICAATTDKYQSAKDPNRTGFMDALILALAVKAETLLLTQFHPSMDDQMLQAELINLQTSLETIKTTQPSSNVSIRLATELGVTTLPQVKAKKLAV